MKRTIQILATVVVVLSLFGIDGAAASSASSTADRLADAVASAKPDAELTPRVQVNSPWGKDDVVNDAARPSGDLRRIIVENGRQQMTFTFRTVATPVWDTAMTERSTGMVFDMDWQTTPAPSDRTLIVSREDGPWVAVILNRNNQVVCSRTGGVRQLTNHRFVISAPVQACLGGAHVLRVGAGFVEDQDDSATVDTEVDLVPQNAPYGPFIRLPNRSRTTEAAPGGWTVR